MKAKLVRQTHHDIPGHRIVLQPRLVDPKLASTQRLNQCIRYGGESGVGKFRDRYQSSDLRLVVRRLEVPWGALLPGNGGLPRLLHQTPQARLGGA